VTFGQLAVAVRDTPPSMAISLAARRARDTAQPIPRQFASTWSDVGGYAVALTRDEALRVPAIHRGVDLIASTVGSFALKCWRGRDQVESTYNTFLAQPEATVPLSVTLTQTVRDLIFDGVAYWRVTWRGVDGYPAIVERLMPYQVVPSPDGGYVTVVGGLYGAKVPTQDMIVFYGPDTDQDSGGNLTSRGLLSTASRTIVTAARLEEAAARYAWNEIPYGTMTTDEGEELDDDEIEELLASWEAARRARATGFLPSGVKWNPVTGPNPEQLQLSEARQYIAAEVARHLNLAPRYVGATSGDSMTYNSQNADRRDFVDLSLRPWLNTIASTLTMRGPGVQRVDWDYGGFLQSDPAEQAGILTEYLAAGVITVDEAREQLGLPPVEVTP
jgi:HK97 family phage portal protein